MPFPTTVVLNSSGTPTTVNTLPNAGQNTKAESLGVVIASDDDIQAKLGIVTETAPASDTASSGLNGRLQRIAQRLTALIALLPTSLGPKTAANSLAVTLATDGALTTVTGTTADTPVANGSGGTIAGYLRAMKDAATSTTPSPVIMSVPYQAVAVSQTSKVLGATGAAGDTLSGIVIQPTGTTVGSVIVYDGATAVYTYPGGTVDASLRPIIVGMGMTCATAWKITTPANATVLALGKFT